MKCKIAFTPQGNDSFFFFFWLHMADFVKHVNFLYKFLFVFEMPFVNPSLMPICFKDQAGLPTPCSLSVTLQLKKKGHCLYV